MPRPKTKQELIDASNLNYSKLMEFIDSMTEEELNTPFDFSMDKSKKEEHWKRDKNLRDVIVHLHEWHMLTINWLANNKAGVRKQFLMEGYNWKTYGDMNQIFWKNAQNVSLKDALAQFEASHNKIMKLIELMPEEEMFTRAVYDWVGTSNIASYFISNTSSHYNWALKKLKAHRRHINGK